MINRRNFLSRSVLAAACAICSTADLFASELQASAYPKRRMTFGIYSGMFDKEGLNTSWVIRKIKHFMFREKVENLEDVVVVTPIRRYANKIVRAGYKGKIFSGGHFMERKDELNDKLVFIVDASTLPEEYCRISQKKAMKLYAFSDTFSKEIESKFE